MVEPRKLDEVPRDAVVLSPSEPLERMLSHLPVAYLADGIPTYGSISGSQ